MSTAQMQTLISQ